MVQIMRRFWEEVHCQDGNGKPETATTEYREWGLLRGTSDKKLMGRHKIAPFKGGEKRVKGMEGEKKRRELGG